jgi:hypothetical protein
MPSCAAGPVKGCRLAQDDLVGLGVGDIETAQHGGADSGGKGSASEVHDFILATQLTACLPAT